MADMRRFVRPENRKGGRSLLFHVCCLTEARQA
jgi:hypothetical protein